MKKRITKRLRGLINGLDAERVAWMWADELPADYGAKRYRPHWLAGEKRGGVVILNGSKELLDRDSYVFKFVDRACRLLNVNTGINPFPGDSKELDAIAARVRSKWPYLRAIHKHIYPRCDYSYWRNGVLTFDTELARTCAELGNVSNTELYYRSRTISSIAKELSRMR